MFKKALNQILILIAIIIVVAIGFTIYSKYKSATPSLSEVSQTGDKDMPEKKIVRQPAVAGAFYPGSKLEVQDLVNGFLAKVSKETETGRPKILIVPHAGYVYSGQVAAYGFKQLVDEGFKKAIILGPSHHFPVTGLFLSGATHWQTPLGEIKIADLNSDLASENGFEINDQVHQPEHSLEVEVPFLQAVAPGIEIMPIIVSNLNVQQRSDFVEVLNKYLDPQTILIVSGDLSHYHPYDEAVELDNQSIADILHLDSQKILDDETCSPWAIAVALELAKQKSWQPKLLNYANSGDVTGDKSAVVGYAAVGFYGENQAISDQRSSDQEYSEDEKQELLGVARTTIEMYLKEGKTYEPQADNPKFKEGRGVFVTLNKHGQLRGCIGYIQPIKPLIEAVRDNAISAAVHDSRFSPVDKSELADIEIEVSILTVPKPDILENIIKDKKGVVLQKGNQGATYLPQVWEDLPDAGQFFQSLCRKGGLAPDCYKDPDTQLLSYEAIVFHE